MKHIGIVGVTASGCALCYMEIVAEAARHSGFPVKHPEISIHNISFSDYFTAGPLWESSGWEQVHDLILSSIYKLKMMGADFVIIPANTIHCEFENLKSKSSLPVINIVDATLEAAKKNGIKSAIILGTKHIVGANLYKNKMPQYGIDNVPIDENIQCLLQSMIEALVSSAEVNELAKQQIFNYINLLDCDAVILACTELPLIFSDAEINKPLLNTTKILANAAFEYAIK